MDDTIRRVHDDLTGLGEIGLQLFSEHPDV